MDFVITGIDKPWHTLLCLYAMILSNLPPVDLKNALSTLLVFYSALLQIKKLTLQKKICGNGTMFIQFTVLPCDPES